MSRKSRKNKGKAKPIVEPIMEVVPVVEPVPVAIAEKQQKPAFIRPTIRYYEYTVGTKGV